jgi:hypothetical protein
MAHALLYNNILITVKVIVSRSMYFALFEKFNFVYYAQT